MKHNTKNFIILFGVFFIASFFRVILNSNNYITNIIAAINMVAFWFVFYLILENAETKYNERLLSDQSFGEHTKIKKRKYFKTIINVISVLVFLFGIVYMIILANSIVNDLISLLALFLSLETEYLYNTIQDIIYKKK